MRGVILAGGTGSRLFPATISISKQLLPVFDKPLIYYPLSTMLLAGIRDIAIITTPRDSLAFERLLGNGDRFGCNFSYITQVDPSGIPSALLLAEGFAGQDPTALILGDNVFHGAGVGETLRDYVKPIGATVFAQQVSNPSEYGVVSFDAGGKAVSLEEKPISPKSKFAVPGLYFYDNSVFDRARELRPSARGETEVTDLNRSYLEDGKLNVVRLPRGTAWLDTGTTETLWLASEFVKAFQSRQGTLVSSPEEIAWRFGYISNAVLEESIRMFGKSSYAEKLSELLSEAPH